MLLRNFVRGEGESERARRTINNEKGGVTTRYNSKGARRARMKKQGVRKGDGTGFAQQHQRSRYHP